MLTMPERFIQFLKNNPVVIVLILASILRFWGIWHDYPFSYYPDEEHFVNRAVAFGSGDLNPHWFHKPAFFMYLLFFEYGLFYLIGMLAGLFSDVNSFILFYFKSIGPFIVIGRITATLFGISTVFMTYKIGKKFWSKETGIYASLIMAVCYGHVFAGQDVKADVPTAFFTVLSVYYLLRVVSCGHRNSDYILSGIFAGLGTATKYYPIALLPCILLVALIAVISKKRMIYLLKYLYSFIAFWGIYFIVSPYNFLDPLGRRSTFGKIVQFWNTISPWKTNIFELEGQKANNFLAHNRDGDYLLNSFLNFFNVLFSNEGVGIIIGIVFVLALIVALRKLSLKKFVLIMFPVLFSIISIVMNPSYTEARHQLIIYPFMSVLAGILICDIAGRAKKPLYLNIFLLVLLLMPLYSIIENNMMNCKDDTRTLAKNWIETNIPAGTKMLVNEESVKLSPDNKYYEKLIIASKKHQKGQFTTHLETLYKYSLKALPEITYDITYIRFPWWKDKEEKEGVNYATSEHDKDMGNPLKPVGVMHYEFYQDNGYEYIIVSSDKYYKYFMDNSLKSINYPSFDLFYRTLFNRALLIKEFDPIVNNSRGPVVKIFKVR